MTGELTGALTGQPTGPVTGPAPVVVVPVRDGAELLHDALVPMVAQAAALGGTVVVVDDGSGDGTGALAARVGAEVLHADGRGPYVAREAAWRRIEDPSTPVVFVDVRCRPRPGWLARLVEALDEPGIAIAGGDVVVSPATHLAGRVAAELQPLAARHGREAAFLPYAPTCNMAVRVGTLTAVGGFRPVRGGGDVDLSWRVQLAGLGAIAWPDAVVDWEPRRHLRELLEQYGRYGANTRQLQLAFADVGCEVSPVSRRLGLLRHEGLALARSLPGRPLRRWPDAAVASACRWRYASGYRDARPDRRLGP